VRDGEVLYEALLGLSEKGGPRHTTALLAEVERAAEAAGGWAAVDRIAVGIGPGSFPGSASPPRGRWPWAGGCR